MFCPRYGVSEVSLHQTHFLVDKKKSYDYFLFVCLFFVFVFFLHNDQMNVDLRAVNYASQFRARSISSLLPFFLW